TMSLLRWKVHGCAKLSHLIFQNLRRVVRKTVEGRHKSVGRKPKARRRSLTKSDDLLPYRHCERIFGDKNIIPLLGESFEGKQIIARPEKPGAETELNCSLEIQLQFVASPDGAIVSSCDSATIGLYIRVRIKFRRKDDQLRRARNNDLILWRRLGRVSASRIDQGENCRRRVKSSRPVRSISQSRALLPFGLKRGFKMLTLLGRFLPCLLKLFLQLLYSLLPFFKLALPIHIS